MIAVRIFPVCLFLSLSALAEPAKPGFSLDSIDRSADPCTDFYQYACGAWVANNPIPADQSSWRRFTELADRNLTLLREILETSAKAEQRAPSVQKIGDHYASCMDEAGIESKGIAPLQTELDRLAALNGKGGLASTLARLHRTGVNAFFFIASQQDYKDSREVIARVDQAGLSLPDRDYYLRTDEKSVKLRDDFRAHVERMFVLLGHTPEKAASASQAVLALETALAKVSLDRVSRRNPEKVYHRMTTKELAALTPSFGWAEYLRLTGAGGVKSLNVAVPDFFTGFESVIGSTSPGDVRAYLSWQYLTWAAPNLPASFVNENFQFRGKTLTGAKELRPRWKRCVESVDQNLGEALGQKYVEATFGGDSKERMLKMVKALEVAMERDIQNLDWMTPTTKKRAVEKLHAVTNKIGYPERWRDYGPVKVAKEDALGNAMRASVFEFERELAKIGKPVDPKEWSMTPPTVNAYYSGQQNNINFPAGILQPPFFDSKMDDAVNFGGIGAVIGHEITHGFDDRGRQFDGKGNFADWWTTADAEEFKKRAECVDKQYGGYTSVGDLKLNGKLTLGENVADNGGLRVAYMALMDTLGSGPREKIEGLSPEQRFFLGWGQVWCGSYREESLRVRTQTDPHSPGNHRVNGTVSNMPEFQKAFGCKVGQPMVRENACRVW